MNDFARYIVLSTCSLSILYLFYKLLIANNTALKAHRWYLLLSLFISLLTPLNRHSFFDFTLSPAIAVFNEPVNAHIDHSTQATNSTTTNPLPVVSAKSKPVNYSAIILIVYLTITGILMLRIMRQFYLITTCYRKAQKERAGPLTLVWNTRYKNSFSFFRLIFLNRNTINTNEQPQVIAHEQVHALQYHSIDVLLVELLAAFTWFNPFVWSYRKSVHLVHEYLADAGVLEQGIDTLHYQALLLNQVAEAELVRLPSGFSHSFINKRFFMMQKKQPRAASKYKLLLLVPVTALLLPLLSCVNEHANNNNAPLVTSIEVTKLNVLYVGVENPVNISVSDHPADAITVTIDNGTITGKEGKYIVKPTTPGKAVIKVATKEKTVQETEFRVKFLPPPVVALKPAANVSKLVKGGDISKEELLKAGGIVLTIENSEFELPIKIASFDIAVLNADKTVAKTASSADAHYSPEQVELINSLKKGQQVNFQNVVAAGPDGAKRKMPFAMDFSIVK